ncbi:hypothetical protein K6V98_07945 [Collinsella sp. AGMB00827]|uniref:Uncharacterized protein n=1 Tax=Collinsella ureilytica TaxID=2869515 RepID=A0ABS7MPH5_9ACTN|nr:hypothetical protein [Collinsella urealyticum]MBY4798275.1 hypothetical protein [Collinsella urealyticum]
MNILARVTSALLVFALAFSNPGTTAVIHALSVSELDASSSALGQADQGLNAEVLLQPSEQAPASGPSPEDAATPEQAEDRSILNMPDLATQAREPRQEGSEPVLTGPVSEKDEEQDPVDSGRIYP